MQECTLHRFEGDSCMQVVVRIRPLNARELGMGDTEVVTVSEEDVQNILVGLLGSACALVRRPHTGFCGCGLPARGSRTAA